MSARGRRPRERAPDDEVRRAVEADLRRYREYKRYVEEAYRRAEAEAAKAAGYAPVRWPDGDHPMASGVWRPPDAMDRMYGQFQRLRARFLADDPEYDRARRVVGAIEAVYASLAHRPLLRRVMELYYFAGRDAADVGRQIGYEESTVRAYRREIVRRALTEFRRRGVATYAEEESA
ncbi:MAG: hypothetical protein QJR08_03690 [Bacillota bacterium]|nr:hypothetical protein [Bacillota bacterium]